jgi:hypothetical protein
MTKAKYVARRGDVFAIPIDSQHWGIAQAVEARMNLLYVAVYDLIVPSLDDASDLKTLDGIPVTFLAQVLDGKIYVGDWLKVGELEVPNGIPFPAYQLDVGFPPEVNVVDYLGERMRPATADEAERLPYREVANAVRLENALKALHGAAPWNDAYDRLYPVKAELTSDAMFGSPS